MSKFFHRARLVVGPNGFARDRRGSISILSVFFTLALLGAGALALESSQLYLMKLKAQRAADLANIAAARTSSPLSNGVVSATASATAANVAALNGFSSATTTAATSTELQTAVSQSVPYNIGAFFGGSSASVGGSAISTFTSIGGPCLEGFTVDVSGGTVYGPNCSIDSNLATDNLGGNIRADFISTGGLLAAAEVVHLLLGTTTLAHGSPSLFNTIDLLSNSLSDPLAALTAVTNTLSHLTSMASTSSWPYNPGTVVPWVTIGSLPTGTSLSYPGSSSSIGSQAAIASFSDSSTNVTFAGDPSGGANCNTPTTISGGMTFSGTNIITLNSGCYEIEGGLTVSSGNTTFQDATGATVHLLFHGGITNNGNGTLSFDAANAGTDTYQSDYNINNNNGGTITFGNGDFLLDSGNINNGASAASTINIGSTSGSDIFYMYGGTLNNNANGRMLYGNGPFYFQNAPINNTGYLVFGNGPFEDDVGSLTTSGSATTIFGTGELDFYGGSISGGGSTFIAGCAQETQFSCLDGSALTAGTTAEGLAIAGAGSINLGGGSYTFDATTMDFVGESITLTSGSGTFSGGGTLDLEAPSSSAATSAATGSQNMALYAESGSISMAMTNAGTNTIAGELYAPNGNISFSGSGTTYSYPTVPSGSCFSAIAGEGLLQSVSVGSGATLDMSPCTAGPTMGSATLDQ